MKRFPEIPSDAAVYEAINTVNRQHDRYGGETPIRDFLFECVTEAKEQGLASPTPEERRRREIWALRLLAVGDRQQRAVAKAAAERMRNGREKIKA